MIAFDRYRGHAPQASDECLASAFDADPGLVFGT